MNNLQFTIYNRIGILLFIVYCSLFITSSTHAQSVDIIWQGETYTHPFYQGRALWSQQSQITLTAIPQGLGNPAELSYKWSRNGTVLGSLSGVGNSSFRFSDSIFSKPITVKVQIVSTEGGMLAENTVNVVPTSPELYAYENNPLYGFMFHREVGSGYSLEDEEVTFSAFPFFAPGTNRQASNLSFVWSSNNSTGEAGNSVTYRAPEEGAGTALIKLNFSNNEAIMPALTKSFLIRFGETNEQ